MSSHVIGETQQRFLRAIVEKVPLERVAELHLFAPIRQGGTETGLAVFATEPDAGEAGEVAEDGLSDDVPLSEVAPHESAASEQVDAASEAGEQPEESETFAEPDMNEAPEASAESADESDGSEDESSGIRGTGAASADPDDVGAATHQTPAGNARVRHVVYTARYRLILKGPDRGKWEFDIRDEAEAPLVTVDAVVRGVQRRVGDIAEVERMTPEQLAIAVSDTPWKTAS